MTPVSSLESHKEAIIEAWLAEVRQALSIEDTAACRDFLAHYLDIILNDNNRLKHKPIAYLNKSLNRGFLSDYSLEQIFKLHLSLKQVIEKIAVGDSYNPRAGAIDNPWLSPVFWRIDKYFLKISELFSSHFNLLINYYRERYTKISENISEIIYSLSPRGGFNYISPSVENILDLAPDNFNRIDDLVKLMPAGDRGAYMQKFTDQLQHKTELTVELQLHAKPKGRLLHFIHHSLPNLDNHGNLISIEGILFDITELRESEEKYRKLIETASDAIFIADVQTGTILDVNRQAEKLIGLPAHKIRGLHQSKLHPKENAEKYIEGFRQAVSGKKSSLKDKYVCHRTGRKIPVEISTSITTIGGKKIIQGIFRDITKRKQAEKDLQRKHHIQSALNVMLSISMKPYPLEEMLKHILKHIVNLPWLTLQSRGAIFLVEDNPGELVMKSHQNMPKKIRSECGRISFDKCLCGRAAQTKEIQFSNCIDERHEIKHKGMAPHGHYCIPILSAGQVLGVLNLYISEGHVRNQEDDNFLKAVANVLAGIIERKKAEEELIKHQQQLEELVQERTTELTKTNKQLKQEIKERRQAEISLIKEKTFSESIINSLPGTFYVFDENDRFVQWNRALEEISGYSAKEVLKMKAIEFIHRADRENIAERIKEVFSKGESSSEANLITKAGDKIPFYFTGIRMIVDGKKYLVGVGINIAERKYAEESLRKSEARLRTAIDSIPFYFFAIDKNGRYMLQNAKLREDWGDIIGKRPEDLEIDKDTLALWQENNRRAFAGEEVTGEISFEINGEQKHFYNVISPIREGGQIPGIMGLNVDITEHKLAEDTLKESEEKFRNLAESSPNMIFINKKGKIVYVNQKCEEIMGYTKAEFYSPEFSYLSIIAPECIALVKENFRKHMQGIEVPQYEYSVVSKQGRKLDSIITTKLINYEGEPAVLGIVTDITERKQAEAELKKFKFISDNSNDAHFLLDKQAKFLYVNKAACKMFGYPEAELLNLSIPVVDVIYDLEKYQVLFDLTQKMPVPAIESIIKRKDGILFPAEIMATGLQIDGKPHMFAALRNITQRKWVEEALLRSERELSIRNQINDVFLAISGEEMYLEVLKVMLNALESKNGCFGYIDEAGALVCPSMTKTICDESRMSDNTIVFPGRLCSCIWEETLSSKRLFCSNKPLEVPDGYIPISRVLSVPIMFRDGVIGNISVVNKAVDYTDNDRNLLENIAKDMAPVLQAKLRKSGRRKKLKRLKL